MAPLPMTTQTPVSDHNITDIAQQYYGESPIAIRKLESSTNYVYLLKFRKQPKKVIKIFKRDNNSIQRELCLYKLLEEKHIPVPKVEYFDTSKSAIPYSWLSMGALGQSLHKLYWHPVYRRFGKVVLRRLFSKAGASLAHVHNIQLEQQGILTETGIIVRPFRDQLENQFVACVDQLVADGCLERTDVVKAEQLFSKFQDSTETSLCHFDFSPKQLLIDGFNISGIIDWEASRASYSVYDFAKCELKFKLHYSMFDAFQRGYYQVRSMPDNYDEIKKPYQLTMILAMLKSVSETSETYGKYRKLLDQLLLC